MTISIRQFRNNLASYLRKVARGTELIITKRDKPIAVVSKYKGVVSAKVMEDK